MIDKLGQLWLAETEARIPDHVRELQREGCNWEDGYQAIVRLWMTIDRLTAGSKINRLELGKAFGNLRDIYSDRNFGGNRRTSGHGCFEQECLERGYKPRTVRDLIAHYEAFLSGKPSPSEKRKARAARKSQTIEKRAVEQGDHLDHILASLAKLTPDELEIVDGKLQALRRKARAIEATPILPENHASALLQ